MPALIRLSEDQAVEVARACYGITATARRLESEHDDTFRLAVADGTARFLRVSAPGAVLANPVLANPGLANPVLANPGPPAGPGTSFLTAILLYLEQTAPSLPVQRVVRSPEGAAELLLAGSRLVRMTTFLDGRLLSAVPSSLALRRDIGATLARLSRALRDFTHPAARRTHRWDLQNAPQLRPLLAELPRVSPPLRARLLATLDRFDAVVRPALAVTPVQVIHTDFHGENLLVTEDARAVCGVLDFGDSLTGPVAMDVAVAACYQLGSDPAADLLAPALDVVAGYHAVDPLRPADLPLIADLIAVRLANRVVVSQWNAAREPANSGYLLRRTAQAVEHFEALGRMAPEDVVGRLRAACGFQGCKGAH